MTHNRIQFLERINGELQEVVEIAEVDFVAVNKLLGKYYSGKDSWSIDPATESLIEMKVGAMIGGLQYMDVFSQRVNHLVLTHEQMLNAGLASDFEDSIFHLHVFQSMTIELDLLRSIASVRILLDQLKEISAFARIMDPSVAFFVNTPAIKTNLQNTISTLLKSAGEANSLPIPTLTSEQVNVLNSVYTMESERLVLKWFLCSMPDGRWEELMECYESKISSVVENTELF
jgi:hypothetical protein